MIKFIIGLSEKGALVKAFRRFIILVCLVLQPVFAGTLDAANMLAPYDPIDLTPGERQWLADHPIIRVAPDPEFQPIESLDENGRLIGIAADYLKILEGKLPIRFQILPASSWDHAVRMAKTRRADMFSAATKSAARSEYMLFTAPYIDLPGVIIIETKTAGISGLEDLHGKKVGVVAGYVWQEWIARDHPEIELMPVPDVQTGLQRVSFGEFDAMVGNLATASYHLKKLGITNLRAAAETGYFARLAIGTRNDWPLLNAILKKAVASIHPDESRVIYDRWIAFEIESGPRTRTILFGVIIFMVVVLVAIGLSVLWNYSLRQMVRRQSESLRQSDERYRMLIEASPDAIMVAREDHIISFANSAAVALFRAGTVDRLIGLSMFDVIHPDDRASVAARRRVLQTAGLMPFAERRRLRLDGSDFYSESRGVPFTWDGEPAVLILIRDITGRKDAEEQLRQSQKLEAVGQLTGGIAHDFNNLLAVIIGNLDLVDEQLDEAGDSRKKVLKAIEAAHRAAALTQRLLAFSRKQPLQPRATDVNGLVIGIIEMLRRTLGEGIELKTEFGENLPPVFADPNQLENALLNLGVNARDAMAGGGRLTIETAAFDLDGGRDVGNENVKPGRYVMLAVTDTGEGIPTDVRKHVFEPFFTTKEVGKGSGLGLSMVHGFVKQSGGHVEFDSVVDEGTTVRLYLPSANGEVAPLDKDVGEKLTTESYRGDGQTVLVVEDDELVSQTTVAMLEELGYRPLEAINGASALALLDGTPDVALMFTDMVLPGGMNGAELAAAALRRRPGLKILYTSGYSEDVVFRGDGVQPRVDLVRKPYGKDLLARSLHEALC